VNRNLDFLHFLPTLFLFILSHALPKGLCHPPTLMISPRSPSIDGHVKPYLIGCQTSVGLNDILQKKRICSKHLHKSCSGSFSSISQTSFSCTFALSHFSCYVRTNTPSFMVRTTLPAHVPGLLELSCLFWGAS
jgi:hypothetical protein